MRYFYIASRLKRAMPVAITRDPTLYFVLIAVQVHQGWSYGNDVNFLAAGASNPVVGSTGSGIYNGRKGILVGTMSMGRGERTLYVAQVPKYEDQRQRLRRETPGVPRLSLRPDINLKRDYLQSYETVMVDLSASNHLVQEVCYNESSFCCNFELKWKPVSFKEDSSHYYYRLGAYDGLRNDVVDETNELKNCALFSCIGLDIMDCGKIYSIDSDVIFENVTITATYPKAKGFLLMPNSLTAADIMPVPVNNFEWSTELTKR